MGEEIVRQVSRLDDAIGRIKHAYKRHVEGEGK